NRMAGRASTTVSASSPSSADKIQSLLRWCQAQTDGYPGVKVTNFTSSFRDGLAFCAILHRYRPELIDFHSLKADNWLQNNQLAFRIAETIGIPALLDAEDMATPEKLSIITYVAYINMHLRGKERRGGPSVNMHSGGNNTSQQQSNASAESASATASSSTPKKRGSSCAMCQGDVFLLERAMDTDGRLCHRQCLLDSRRVDLRRAANEALEKRRRCDNEDAAAAAAAAAVANNGAPLQVASPDDSLSLEASSDENQRSESPACQQRDLGDQRGLATIPVRQQLPQQPSKASLTNGAGSAAADIAVKTASSDASATETGPPEASATETGPPEASATETGPPEASATETGPSEASATETGPPEASATETGPPEASTTKTAVPEASAPQSAPSEASATETGPPEASTTETAVPEASAPESAPPEASAPESAPSEASAPEAASLETSIPESAPASNPIPESAPAAASVSESAPEESSTKEAAPAAISAVAPSALATASAQISGPAPTAVASSPFGSPASVRRSARKPAPAPPPPPPSKRAQSQLARSATTVGAASSAKPKTVDVDLYPEEFNPFKDETPVSSSSKTKPPKPPAPPPQRPPPAPRRPQSVAPATAAAAYPEELNPFGEPDDQSKAAKPPPPRPQPAAASSSGSNINKSANSAKPSVSLPASRSSSMEPLYRAGSPGPSAIAGKSFRKSRHAPPPPPQAQGTPKSTSTSNASATAAYASMPVSAQASPQTTPASTPTHLSASDLHHRSSALRAKGPAPPRPCQSERRQILTEAADEFEGIDAIEQELAAVGAKQAEIESRGRVLYDKLKRAYGYGTLGYKAELDNSDSEEPLLLEWIGLVNERNRLCREELYLLRRSEERELELQHSSIEFDLRRVMSKQEALKTESDRELERSLLAQLTNVVDRRARIIDLIDASQREQEEQEQLLAATLASASASVQEQKIDKSKKDKKKHKKEERISKLSSIKLKKKPTSSTEQEAGNNNEEKPDQHRKHHHRKFKLFSSVGCGGKNKEKKDEA
ncbi:hypothetical protein BOX15_Mlig000929g3, partial [Macrostomum lignano]